MARKAYERASFFRDGDIERESTEFDTGTF